MRPAGYYNAIESVRRLVKDRAHVSNCLPTFLADCLRERLWEREIEDPYAPKLLPPVSFHDFVHNGEPRGLGSTYEQIEAAIRDDPELVKLWEQCSGRTVREDVRLLALADIRRDPSLQARVAIDPAIVSDYVDHVDQLPPPTVFFDGDAYWLADGFHRVAAHEQAGRAELACDVRAGSRRDAILHAVGSNAAHGLRRTNADKRRAVGILLGDEEWAAKSDRWIAEQCGVSHPFVSKLRPQVETVTSCGEIDTSRVVLGQDGKERVQARSHSAPTSLPHSSHATPVEAPSAPLPPVERVEARPAPVAPVVPMAAPVRAVEPLEDARTGDLFTREVPGRPGAVDEAQSATRPMGGGAKVDTGPVVAPDRCDEVMASKRNALTLAHRALDRSKLPKGCRVLIQFADDTSVMWDVRDLQTLRVAATPEHPTAAIDTTPDAVKAVFDGWNRDQQREFLNWAVGLVAADEGAAQ